MERNYSEEQKYEIAKKKVKQEKGFYVHLIVYVLVNLFLILSRVIGGGGLEVFTEWQSYSTAFFWGIGIAFHSFNVFGLDFILGKNWEERKIKEKMEQDKREFWE